MKTTLSIEPLILAIRGKRIVLGADLAAIYGVEVRTLIQAVKRNRARFPEDFVFQLSREEFNALRSQNAILADGRATLRSQTVILKHGQHAKYPPYAFTEHGALMAANVLQSKRAVQMSVFVIRAFMRLREHVAANTAIIKRLAEIDKTLLQHDAVLSDIYRKLLPLLQPEPVPRKRRIGFIADDDA
ncbi:MAG: ORF6N domain-containing protein [Burkholderiales bacterium]|nr:ORF6N domain-containing protein [Burkholderiales bacterium]